MIPIQRGSEGGAVGGLEKRARGYSANLGSEKGR